ncbi:metal ABC transporter permease [Priestia megaterium]|uniref:methionine ABC transporter permease n=1 Tax=Priestia megaterium TaxID=1404 RepID=UPI000BF6AB05|nr:methionine ABC transporter permease [Priestia megaterium]PFL00773.1 metal ABC transporter permease [Priestia megaterium]RCX29390.1 D-methionine transport system permease protein [Bacillus sp. AG236]
MQELYSLFSQGIIDTTVMVLISLILSTLVGIPLGILLVITRQNHLLSNTYIFTILNTIINILRSVPFIVLLVAIIPFTTFIVGTPIGIRGAVVPLIVYTAPYIARLMETTLLEVDWGVIEAYRGMGASKVQIVFGIMLRESRSGIILCLTIATIGLIGASAMAGAVGAGGLGDLALRYGYQQWDLKIMFITVIILIAIVQLVQSSGNYLSKKLQRK